VCASLTELFAPEIHRQRVAGWPQYYPWIDPAGLEYFQTRASLAARDVEFALTVTLERFTTRAAQERALEVLQLKLDILWHMNGAMALAYGVTT
jgi:pyrroloquinoline-quinone synthase